MKTQRPIELFNPESGEFKPAGTATIIERDGVLLEMGRYLEDRVRHKSKVGLDVSTEAQMLAKLRERLEAA